MADEPFVSECCEGQRCMCGRPAVRKIAEVVFDDDPLPNRHELTAYVCAEHFIMVMGKRTGLESLCAPSHTGAQGKDALREALRESTALLSAMRPLLDSPNLQKACAERVDGNLAALVLAASASDAGGGEEAS